MVDEREIETIKEQHYKIKNRWTHEVQFTAKIECNKSADWGVKLGLAVKVAFKGGAYLGGADLSGAYLRGADLSYADLGGVNLYGADMRGADMRGAYMRDVNLSGANLNGVYLVGAYLRGADMRGANLGGLILFARVTRLDGHEYFAWTSILGGLVITAGCRTWIGGDAIKQAREHCQTVTSRRYQSEALRIVDFIEGAATALQRDAA